MPLAWDAHDLTRTRFCAAQNCPEDALTGWALCDTHARQHQRGQRIPLHPPPEQPEPVLYCGCCKRWKPDDEFPPSNQAIGGPPRNRRGKSHACVSCHVRGQVEKFNQRKR